MIEDEDEEEKRLARKIAKNVITLLKQEYENAPSHVIMFALARILTLLAKSVGMTKKQFFDLMEICYKNEETNS